MIELNKDFASEVEKLEGPIFIIGASGFIGANLYHTIAKYRKDVYALSRNPKHSPRLAGVERTWYCDITDIEQVRKAFMAHKPRTVFNCSAYGGYSYQDDPIRIHQTNFIGVVNMFRVIEETGCAVFIQAGSSSEYGINAEEAVEGNELIPNSHYSVSKIATANLIKYYGTMFQFPAVNLRLFAVYGQMEEQGRLIRTVIEKGLRGEVADYANAEISRDFIHVEDVVRAFVKAAVYGVKSYAGESINVCTGKKTRLGDVAATAAKVFKLKGQPKFGSFPQRKWDLVSWYGDPTFAKKAMGFEAEIEFEEGLRYTAKMMEDSHVR